MVVKEVVFGSITLAMVYFFMFFIVPVWHAFGTGIGDAASNVLISVTTLNLYDSFLADINIAVQSTFVVAGLGVGVYLLIMWTRRENHEVEED